MDTMNNAMMQRVLQEMQQAQQVQNSNDTLDFMQPKTVRPGMKTEQDLIEFNRRGGAQGNPAEHGYPSKEQHNQIQQDAEIWNKRFPPFIGDMEHDLPKLRVAPTPDNLKNWIELHNEEDLPEDLRSVWEKSKAPSDEQLLDNVSEGMDPNSEKYRGKVDEMHKREQGDRKRLNVDMSGKDVHGDTDILLGNPTPEAIQKFIEFHGEEALPDEFRKDDLEEFQKSLEFRSMPRG